MTGDAETGHSCNRAVLSASHRHERFIHPIEELVLRRVSGVRTLQHGAEVVHADNHYEFAVLPKMSSTCGYRRRGGSFAGDNNCDGPEPSAK